MVVKLALLIFVLPRVSESIERRKGPVTSTALNNGCPDPSTVYENSGYIYSPGYPQYLDATDGLRCIYKLTQNTDYKFLIEVRFEGPEFLGPNDVIRIYEGWDANSRNLLGMIQNKYWQRSFRTKTSDKMLIEFEGNSKVIFEFYFELENGDSPPEWQFSPMCPEANVFITDTVLTSAGFPFVYETNVECSYWLLAPNPNDSWEIVIDQFNLGKDDGFYFYDVANNDYPLRPPTAEGQTLRVPASAKIIFYSGEVNGMFNRWRFVVTLLH